MRYSPSSRLKFVLVLAVLAMILPQVSTAASPGVPAQPSTYAPGEVLIGWEPGAGPVPQVQREPGPLGIDRADPAWPAVATELSSATGLAVLEADPTQGTARLAVPIGSEEAEIRRLAALPWVSYAEPNYYAYAAAAFYPNDPDFPKQWNLHRIGAPQAWSAMPNSPTVIVAVLDTGVAQGHPEFAGRLLPGFNFINPTLTPEDNNTYSHGTHVTGILAAQLNNGIGVAGLAPANVLVLPLKVLDSNGSGTQSAIAAAIDYAVANGARVINLSIESLFSTQTLENAVANAQARGALVVAAGGNCAQNPAACGGQVNPVIYPAAYPGVLAVAASDRFDNAAPYSGYKPYIGVAAPGGTADQPIWSTIRDDSYGWLYGTSMSTPLASAAAALVWTLQPAYTPAQVASLLEDTADEVGTDPYSGQPLSYTNGRNDYFGAGRLNVGSAVIMAYPPSINLASNQASLLLVGPTTSTEQSIDVTNPSGQAVSWTASVATGSPWLSLVRSSGISLYGSPSPLTLRAERLNLAPGLYAGAVKVDAPGLGTTVYLQVQLRVASTLTRAFVPLVMQAFETPWLDPDAPGSLSRTVLFLANDSAVSVSLPFPVSYYGSMYQSLQVSDNGYVTFGGLPGAAPPPSMCPGNGMRPNNAVYVLGYDWNLAPGGQIIVHQPDPNTYVVTWRDVHRSGNPMPQSFQLVIHSSSTFRGNYRSVESPLPGMIGTENYDAAFSQQVLCNGAGRQVKSGESVLFETRLPW